MHLSATVSRGRGLSTVARSQEVRQFPTNAGANALHLSVAFRDDLMRNA